MFPQSTQIDQAKIKESLQSPKEAGATLLCTVLVPELEDSSGLAGAELVHAGIVGVVHEVVNWVLAGVFVSLAGVLALGASLSGISLGWSVIDLVTTIAAVLEGVEKTQPVSNFVSGSLLNNGSVN